MLEAYRQHTADRAALGIPPLPLDAEQTSALCELLQHPPAGEEANLIALLRDRVPPGVDPAAYVKAGFLTGIVIGKITSPLINKIESIELLGTMLGGYNVRSLTDLLQCANTELATAAVKALSKIVLVYDAFNDVWELSQTNPYAKQVIDACRRVTGTDIRYKMTARRPGDPARLIGSADLARAALGWRPDIVAIDDIVTTAWNWMNRKEASR